MPRGKQIQQQIGNAYACASARLPAAASPPARSPRHRARRQYRARSIEQAPAALDDDGHAAQAAARGGAAVPPPGRVPAARPRRRRGVRLLGRRRGAGQGGGAAAQGRGDLLHPGRRRGRRRGAHAGPPVPGAAAGHGPVPRPEGLRGRRHPRHGARPHPARGLRRAGLAVPRGDRALEEVPVRGDGRHGGRDRHADGGHRRHGVLRAPDGRQQEGRRGRRRRADGARALRRGRPGDGGGLRRRARARDVRAGARADRRRRARAPPCHLSGAGAGGGGALADHRDVDGRLGFPQHGAAARPGVDVPPALRGHRPRRVHRPGQVSPQIHGSDGALLLRDDPGRRRHRHRNIVRVRRDEPDGAGCAGYPRGRGSRDPGLHGARGHPGRGLHERQGAEQSTASARAERLVTPWGWLDVHASHLGLTTMQ